MVSVVYACNNAYARQTLVSMISVIQHNPDAKIYLIGDQLSEEQVQMIQQVLNRYGKKVRLILLESVLPDLKWDEADRHPRTIYAKLFMESVIEEERVLYLDSDVIVKDSLKPLFDRPMEDECIAGVLMPYSSKLKRRIRVFEREPYICDGVVLFNLDLWKEKQISEKCLQYIQECQGNPPMLSEGTLNHVCRGMIGVLTPEYNLMPSMIEYSLKQLKLLFKADFYYDDERLMESAKRNPVIIHFMNELYNRPWNTPCAHPYKDQYRCVEKMIFQKNELVTMPLSKHTRMTVFLKRTLPFWMFAALYHIKNKE